MNIGGVFGWSSYDPYSATSVALEVTDFYNKGNITATAGNTTGYSGGIFGGIKKGAFIAKNVYNEGNLTLSGSMGNAGGIAGYIYGVSKFYAIHNTGNINHSGSTKAHVGGLFGYMENTADVLANGELQTDGTTIVEGDKNIYNTGNITYDGTGSGNVGGLFGNAAGLKLTGENIYNSGDIEYAGSGNLGGIAGYVGNLADFDNVYNTGKIVSTSTKSGHIGGLVGYAGYNSTVSAIITDSYNTGNIETNGSSPSYGIGGIAGRVGCDYRGNLIAENLYNTGTITVKNTSGPVGGLVGHVQGYLDIKNSHNSGEINTQSSGHVGGIAGVVASTDVNGQQRLGALIEHVYNTANITNTNTTSSGRTGGIIGTADNWLTMNDAYNTGTITTYTKGATGGIAGYISGSGGNITTLTNIHNTGKIYSYNSDGGNIGGLVGYLTGGSSTNFVLGDEDNLSYNSGDIYYAGTNNIGGIAGSSTGYGKIINVKNTGIITATNSAAGSIGGIIGTFSSSSSSSISKAENMPDISYSGNGVLGGIIGHAMNVSVYDSTNHGNLTRTGGGTGHGSATGGIVGNSLLGEDNQYFKGLRNYGNITIEGTNTGQVGGILGYGGRSMNFNDVVNYGDITGANMGNTGGVVGETVWAPYFTETYNNGNITYTGTAGPIIGGILGYTENALTFNGTRNKGNIVSSGSGNVGGIVGAEGQTFSITLNNVFNEGSITVTNNDAGDVGGIIGYTNGNITGDTVGNLATAKITYYGQKSVGGLIGGVSDGRTVATTFETSIDLKNIYNVADIDASGMIKTSDKSKSGAGGIVGYIWADATFENAYNLGNITYGGEGYLAGIIGCSLKQTTLKGTVYNTGILTGTNANANEAGGIMAKSRYAMLLGGTTEDSTALTIYNTGNISYAGNRYVGGIIGDVENNLEMKNVSNSGNITTANAIDVGGMVGHVSGTFSSTRSENAKTVVINYSGTGNIGGVLGKGDSTVSLTDTTNFANLTSLTGSNIGGLVGMAGGKLTASNVKNVGTITFGTDDTAITTGSGHHISGLFAYVNNAVDIDGAENAGTIYAKGTNIAESGGILGFATGNATIKNATNRGNIYYNGDSNLGGVTGQLEAGATLENLYNYGHLTISNANAHSAGGVFASTKMKGTYQVTLKNAFNYGDIDFGGGGGYKVGGIMGYGRNIAIENVYNSGNITVTNSDAGAAGGIIGVFSNQNGATGSSIVKGDGGQITNEGNIIYSGAKYVGGIIGESDIGTSLDGAINTGALTAHSGEGLGGFYGYLNADTSNRIINSTNSGSLKSAGDNIGGIVGVLEKSTVEITGTKNLVALETLSEGNTVSKNIGGAIGWAKNISSDFTLNDFTTSQEFVFGKNAEDIGAVIGKYTGTGNGAKITVSNFTNNVRRCIHKKSML